jgi:hypothetical protein
VCRGRWCVCEGFGVGVGVLWCVIGVRPDFSLSHHSTKAATAPACLIVTCTYNHTLTHRTHLSPYRPYIELLHIERS